PDAAKGNTSLRRDRKPGDRYALSAARAAHRDLAPFTVAIPRAEISELEALMTDKDYYTPQELSALLAIPQGTLRQWRYLRVGPPWTKLRKRVIYLKALVHAWIQEQTVLPRNSKTRAG